MAAHLQPEFVAASELGGPALRAFFKLAEQWGLRISDQRRLLGDPPESTFYKWKRQQEGSLGRDVLERISYLLGIYKDLQILYPEPEFADRWVRLPNSHELFGGRPALSLMTAGGIDGLYRVRRLLDGRRG